MRIKIGNDTFNGKITVENDGTMKMFHSKNNNHPVKLEEKMVELKGGTVVDLNFLKSRVIPENLEYAGHSDWRLPNVRELQSIVDYTRCPDVTNSAAIDPIFSATSFKDPAGHPGQYGYYWTGTSHLDGANPYASAVYIAFGEAQGEMNGNLMDVHGAGAQRSDPKVGDAADYPYGHGPQGDVIRINNFVRLVRNAE